MAANEMDWPEEGELLVCSVKNVRQNGAYVKIDAYDGREGFIFIGEIASGWVKNIRNHIRSGQRVVAKVMRVRKDKHSVDLSIKAVSDERRRDTLQSWKNEQRAGQLLRLVGERSEWDAAKRSEMEEELVEYYGSLYGAFEESVVNSTSLAESGFSGEWTTAFIELACENISPPYVTIRGQIDIQVLGEAGIGVIREALSMAEECSNEENEVEVCCYYDGAPHYRVEVKAPDYKLCETAWNDVNSIVESTITAANGSVSTERE